MRWGIEPAGPFSRSWPWARSLLGCWRPISCRCRPAVSQHLRVLKEAELVVESVAGARRLYRINQAGLIVARDHFDRFWETTLDSFALLAAVAAEGDNRKAPPDPTNCIRPDEGRPRTSKEHR